MPRCLFFIPLLAKGPTPLSRNLLMGKGLGHLPGQCLASTRLNLLDPAGGFVKNKPAGLQAL